MVGMTDTRGYHAVITCWWDAPTTRISGHLVHETEPARGSYLFYAPGGETPAPWRQVALDATGAYTIPALLPGTYLFATSVFLSIAAGFCVNLDSPQTKS